MGQAAANGKNIWKAAGISLLSSAATYGIGSLFGGVGSLGKEALRAGAHGLSSGVTTALSGGNFLNGFASGALSSGIGSFAQGIRIPDGAMIGYTTAMGGLASLATGGDFWQGAANGLRVGLLNHSLHGMPYKKVGDGYYVAMESLDEVVCIGHKQSGGFYLAASLSLALLADDGTGFGVADDVAIPVIWGAAGIYSLYENRSSIQNGIARAYNSISAMVDKTMNCRPGYVYHLVANSDGLYPNASGGVTNLKAGETWKIGETINGEARYTQKYLNNLNVTMEPRSALMTNKYQLWIEEKRQLINYATKYGCLPPGNKVFK